MTEEKIYNVPIEIDETPIGNIKIKQSIIDKYINKLIDFDFEYIVERRINKDVVIPFKLKLINTPIETNKQIK